MMRSEVRQIIDKVILGSSMKANIDLGQEFILLFTYAPVSNRNHNAVSDLLYVGMVPDGPHRFIMVFHCGFRPLNLMEQSLTQSFCQVRNTGHSMPIK